MKVKEIAYVSVGAAPAGLDMQRKVTPVQSKGKMLVIESNGHQVPAAHIGEPFLMTPTSGERIAWGYCHTEAVDAFTETLKQALADRLREEQQELCAMLAALGAPAVPQEDVRVLVSYQAGFVRGRHGLEAAEFTPIEVEIQDKLGSALVQLRNFDRGDYVEMFVNHTDVFSFASLEAAKAFYLQAGYQLVWEFDAEEEEYCAQA